MTAQDWPEQDPPFICACGAPNEGHPSPCSYELYLQELDADAEREVERRRQPTPHAWGDRLSETHYFCEPCWQRGRITGAHSYEHPPCDPMPHEYWLARWQ